MNKIVIVEDNREFKDLLKRVISKSFPECKISMFYQASEAIKAISFVDKDFDILLLDGSLGWGGHGRSVLKILTPEQLAKTILCSADDDFIAEAKNKGISIFLDKGFAGVRASQLDSYILGILAKI